MKITPSIDIIIGPMYAGKTTELLRRLEIYAKLDVKTLYINSILDSRSSLPFSSHNPLLNSAKSMICDHVKVKNLCDVNCDKYQVIGIDEGQFFGDLKTYVTSSINKDKKIIISGLNGDFKQQPFGDIINLIPCCDSIDLLTPFCKLCKDRLTPAPFTKRTSNEKHTISVDTNYIPVCRKHL